MFELVSSNDMVLVGRQGPSPQWLSKHGYLLFQIKTFILQVKSQPSAFNVCSHFKFTRALLYDVSKTSL